MNVYVFVLQHLELVEGFLRIKIETKMYFITPVSIKINSNSRKKVSVGFLCHSTCLVLRLCPHFRELGA